MLNIDSVTIMMELRMEEERKGGVKRNEETWSNLDVRQHRHSAGL